MRYMITKHTALCLPPYILSTACIGDNDSQTLRRCDLERALYGDN